MIVLVIVTQAYIVCIYIHTYIRTYIHKHIHTHRYIYIYLYIPTHVHIQISIYIYTLGTIILANVAASADAPLVLPSQSRGQASSSQGPMEWRQDHGQASGTGP